MDYYYSLGLRNVRIPLLWERMQPTLNAALNTDYFNLYDGLVQYALNKSMTVIIDPHNYGSYRGNKIGSTAVTVNSFLNFWKLLAAPYKTRSDLVIFGLMNEPVALSSNTWFSAVQSVITNLRTNGYKNTIFVPGNFYTGAWSWNSTASFISTDTPIVSNAAHALALTDPLNNIVFEVHQYFDSDYSGRSAVCPTTTTAEALFSTFEKWLAANNKYGYLGEFAGGANAGCATIVKAALARIKSNSRWVGTSWWAGGPWWGASNIFAFETSTLTGTTTQMTWQQQYLIPYQRSKGYNPVSTSRSDDSGSFAQESGATTLAASWVAIVLAMAAFLF